MVQKAFELGNMCDDLVELTIEICGKDEDKCPRFPKWSYATLVERIMNAALDIQEQIIEANEYRLGETRAAAQKMAAAKCVYLNHLVRLTSVSFGHRSYPHRKYGNQILRQAHGRFLYFQ